MAKKRSAGINPVSVPAGAIVARAGDAAVEFADSGSGPGQDQIAQLAYFYWHARGCPEGSPEQDWIQAEVALRKPAAREVVP